MTLQQSKIHRQKYGSLLAELGPALIVAVPIFLTIFVLAMIFNAAKVNDAAAVQATRAIAAGDPRSATERAEAIVKNADESCHVFDSSINLISIEFSPKDILAQEAAMIPLGGSLSGTVTVMTQITLKVPVIGKPVTFNSSTTSPFTYNVPNTAGGITPAP